VLEVEALAPQLEEMLAKLEWELEVDNQELKLAPVQVEGEVPLPDQDLVVTEALLEDFKAPAVEEVEAVITVEEVETGQVLPLMVEVVVDPAMFRLRLSECLKA
jgi:hypothetical protein